MLRYQDLSAEVAASTHNVGPRKANKTAQAQPIDWRGSDTDQATDASPPLYVPLSAEAIDATL